MRRLAWPADHVQAHMSSPPVSASGLERAIANDEAVEFSAHLSPHHKVSALE